MSGKNQLRRYNISALLNLVQVTAIVLSPDSIHFLQSIAILPHTRYIIAVQLSKLQFGMPFRLSMPLNFPLPPRQIRHPHNLNNETGPTCEVLRPLPLPCLRIILLPGETRFRPGIIDGFDEIQAEATVERGCLLLVRTRSLCESLS